MRRAIAAAALLATSCTSMEPKYVRPDPAVPASWPVGDAYLMASEVGLPALTYKQVFTDPRLQTLIAEALNNDRNLMTAAANVAAAREQYRIQRMQQFPTVDANAGATVSGNRAGGGSSSGSSGGRGSGSNIAAQFQAGVSVPSYEVDLFGRLRSLTDVQLNRYFSTEAGARATRLTLVSNIASAWLNHAADSSLLLIDEQTAASAQKSVRLTRLRLEGGIAPRTDLDRAEQILDSTEADLARQRTAVAQDINALRLLVGGPVDPSLLAHSIDEAFGTVAPMPTGLDSYVLLRRPDVVQAEYELRAANANIGAARATLFPRISLTGLLGFASSALLKLFTGGAFGWSAGANASYTIFQAGAGHANVRLSEAQKRAAISTYQGTVQTAFREVSDGLAGRATFGEQLRAQAAQTNALAIAYRLADLRYRSGAASFLDTLDAARTLFAAQILLVQAQTQQLQNQVALYRALGGGWNEVAELAAGTTPAIPAPQ